MSTALIGYSGFVGYTLDARIQPEARFRSTNIDEIRGRSFKHVVCAGVQAMKWWANLHPAEDRSQIDVLLDALKTVQTERFTLISTIDVYPSPRDVVEDSRIERQNQHAYGLHRLQVEDWVVERFPRVLILRLPGLFGPRIKKNVIFDMMHENNLDKIHPDGVFQYYDLRRLADDIDRAWDLGIDLLNVSSEPTATYEIRDRFFPDIELGAIGTAPAGYDMRSKHANVWAGQNGYLYSKAQVLADLGDWLNQEKLKAEI
jgi:nucleoside-diphosphate-sugar epimerase